MATASKVPISVCVIAQDEEDRIGACLESAAFAAELLVLDGGSRDRTREVAASLGARVEERPFDGFASQRAAAIRLARHDWVLALDADERVSPELAREVQELFAAGAPSRPGYSVPRRAWYLGRWIRGGGWYPDRKLRLFDRRRARCAGREPHDKVLLDGPAGRLRGDLLHYPYRDLADHVARMDRYTSAAARAMHAEGRRWPLLRMLVSPPLRFWKSWLLRGGFRDGAAGLVLAVLAGVYEAVRYAKLWELRRRPRAEVPADRERDG